jgi:hypothetical protein
MVNVLRCLSCRLEAGLGTCVCIGVCVYGWMQLELDCLNSGVYCSNTWKNEREKRKEEREQPNENEKGIKARRLRPSKKFGPAKQHILLQDRRVRNKNTYPHSPAPTLRDPGSNRTPPPPLHFPSPAMSPSSRPRLPQPHLPSPSPPPSKFRPLPSSRSVSHRRPASPM